MTTPGASDQLFAAAGYCLDDNLKKAYGFEHDWLIATGRLKHHERVPGAPSGRIPKDITPMRVWLGGCTPRRAGRLPAGRRSSSLPSAR